MLRGIPFFMAQTQSELLGLNQELVPVERLIFDGLQRSFLRVFKAPSVWVTSSDKVKATSRLFGGKSVSYPYVYLTLNSSTTPEDRQNTSVAARRGMIATVSTDTKRYFRVNFLPEDFEVGVELVTNRYEDLLRFNNTWKFARKRGWLKFEVAYGSVSFGVSVLLEPTVSFPQRTAEPDEVQEYVMSSTLTVLGYLSDPILLEGQVTDTIQEDGILADGSNTTVWSLKTARESLFDATASPDVPTNMR